MTKAIIFTREENILVEDIAIAIDVRNNVLEVKENIFQLVGEKNLLECGLSYMHLDNLKCLIGYNGEIIIIKDVLKVRNLED